MAQSHAPVLQASDADPVPFVVVHSLPSQIAAISPFVDRLMRFVRLVREADGSDLDIEMALREAVTNAVIHGNHEDPTKRVGVVCRCGLDGEVSFTIRDQGEGFDPHTVSDPTDPESRMATHGRGIHLIRALMDEVSFEEGGTVVHMRKKPDLPLHVAVGAAEEEPGEVIYREENSFGKLTVSSYRLGK